MCSLNIFWIKKTNENIVVERVEHIGGSICLKIKVYKAKQDMESASIFSEITNYISKNWKLKLDFIKWSNLCIVAPNDVQWFKVLADRLTHFLIYEGTMSIKKRKNY